MIPFEAMAVAVAIGFYVYDSMLLLYVNEAVLLPIGSNRWQAYFGSEEFTIFGRELFLPNLLLPHRPIFKLSWRLDGAMTSVLPTSWTTVTHELTVLSPMTLNMAISLFVLLPFCLFQQLGTVPTLIVVGFLYINILASIAWLCYRRNQLSLTKRRLAGLAFESLVCAPFAINLIRKVSLGISIAEEFPDAAKRLLSSKDWAWVQEQCLSRIDYAIDSEAVEPGRKDALQTHRLRFIAEDISVNN